MAVRYFALTIGLIYTAAGILGFIPALVATPQETPAYMATVGVTTGFGYLLGLFPVNIVHNIVHLTFGIFGIAAYAINERVSRLFSDTLAVWFGLLGVLGLIPVANTVFGIMPAFGNDVWLHLGTAAVAAYFGFFRDSGYLFSDPQQAEQFEKSSN
ncbi:MAG: DUF4383 domain-containing protein [Leptolyngbya sp. SIO4C1]|nr:DUF4383 domain-containing protein [Leptolyngbya sp. SIO4C1]